MPIYSYRCSRCNSERDVFRQSGADAPDCCGKPMDRVPTFAGLVKIKGAGGGPYRRKQIHGSAPYS